MLTKRAIVCQFLWLADKWAVYAWEDHDSSRFINIHADEWQDMGEPEKITITIQPGDSLNA